MIDKDKQWKKVKLRDVIELTMGQSPASKYYNTTGVGLPFLQGNRTFGYKYPYFDTYCNKNKKIVNRGDILMSVRAPVGDLNIAQEDIGIGRGLCGIKGKGIDQAFLYYLLKYSIKDLISKESGTVFGSIGKNDILSLDVYIPESVQIQKNIANILGKLDEKIEINNEINNNLEKLAQSIFNKYFIKNKTKYNTWEKSNLTSIGDYLNGIAIKKYISTDFNNRIPAIKIRELRQGFIDSQSEYCSKNIKKEYIIKDGDLIFSWSGTLIVDFWCGGTSVLNQHLFKITPKKKYNHWFCYLWTKYHLNNFINIAKAKATTMGHIKRSDLEKAVVYIPDTLEYNKLNLFFEPLYNKIIMLKIENRCLLNIKNSLLPKLLSGELDIEKIKL